MLPLVTIIIPVYNAEKYIERCAKSVFMQSYTNLEIIFVDDCSTDSSMNILRQLIRDEIQLKDRVVLVTHDVNKGSACTRSTGLKASHGDYVIQVDSDDFVAKDYIKILLKAILDSDADISMCDIIYDYGNHQETHKFHASENSMECLSQVLIGTVHGSLANKLIKRQLYTANDINTIPGINMYDDKSVVFRLLYYSKRIANTNIPLYYYNMRNEVSITSQNQAKEEDGAIRLIILMNDFFKDKEIDSCVIDALNYFKIGIESMILLYGHRVVLENNKDAFGRHSVSTIWHHPRLPFYYKLAASFYEMHFILGVFLVRFLVNGMRMMRFKFSSNSINGNNLLNCK